MKKVSYAKSLSFIVEKLKTHPFAVPKILQHYHIQTLGVNFMPYFRTALPSVERIYITLSDGSKIAADCIFQQNRKMKPTIVVMNGFTGSSRSYFSRSMKHKAFYCGFNVILLMQRGEGDSVPLTSSLFTAYPQYDMPIALRKFSEMGLKRIYLIGLSLGGWAALLTLGTMGKSAQEYLCGAAVVSCPGNLLDTWERIEKNSFYNFLLLQAYKHVVKKRVKVDPSGTWDLEQLKLIKTKRQFFETFLRNHTCGSKESSITLNEYNKRTNCMPLLKNIQVPSLIIHSSDDPVCPSGPYLRIKNPYISTLMPVYGGHGGFFTTKKPTADLDGLWAQNRSIEFIQLLDARR
jgi:predicted alpha/beta-fold hydrolase